MFFTLVTIVLVAAALIAYRRTIGRPPNGYTTAPGPKGLPALGNTHQLGPLPHRQITQWARQYGEIFKIRLSWNDWYILCSPAAVKEVMDRQSKDSPPRAPRCQ
jgi:hypothetical protein